MISRSPRSICLATVLIAAVFVAVPASAQISPPSGTAEIRYIGHPFYGDFPLYLFHGTAAFVDFDGDDYMDLVMTGLRSPLQFQGPDATGYFGIFAHRTQLQALDPGVFDSLRYYEQKFVSGLPGLYDNALAIADHNNDGRPDLGLSGRLRTAEPALGAFLVEQVDSLVFNVLDPGWLPVQGGSMAWGDYDNDGQEDMLLTGKAESGFATRLYQNQGEGLFQPVDAGLPDIGYGEAVWGDSDNDGDLDILLCGVEPGGRFVSAVYLNDGGQFVEAGINLPGVAFGSARWIDLNADGLLDILLNGAELSPFILEGGLYVYLNRGGNVFELRPTDIPAHFNGDLDLIDWDTDGDVDVLASGYLNPLRTRAARLYRNEDGSFEIGYNFLHLVDLYFATGDYDRDHDVDVFVTGFSNEPFGLIPPLAAIFNTDGFFHNSSPSIPTGLSATATSARVDLSWSASTDDVTPDPSLTYNLRVGTSPGTIDVVSPLADPISGKRLVCKPGNVFHNTSWHLESLPPGTYYWSVQAIDQSCIGSGFAEEGSFTIEGDATDVEDEKLVLRTELEASYPNPFRDRTTIRFSVPQQTHATLSLYDVLGRTVRTLVDADVSAGTHAAVWNGTSDDGTPLTPGLYIYRLRTGESARTGSVMLIQ